MSARPQNELTIMGGNYTPEEKQSALRVAQDATVIWGARNMPQQVQNQVARLALVYKLDPALNHMNVLGSKPYITVEGYKKHAENTGKLLGIRMVRLDTDVAGEFAYDCFVTKDLGGGKVGEFPGWGSANPSDSQMKGARSIHKHARSRAIRDALSLAFPIGLENREREDAGQDMVPQPTKSVCKSCFAEITEAEIQDTGLCAKCLGVSEFEQAIETPTPVEVVTAQGELPPAKDPEPEPPKTRRKRRTKAEMEEARRLEEEAKAPSPPEEPKAQEEPPAAPQGDEPPPLQEPGETIRGAAPVQQPAKEATPSTPPGGGGSLIMLKSEYVRALNAADAPGLRARMNAAGIQTDADTVDALKADLFAYLEIPADPTEITRDNIEDILGVLKG